MTESDELTRLQRAIAGRFSIDRELGRGGMGIVCAARDVALERTVAIKMLSPYLAARPDARARFLREARTAANLSHPNIVPIHFVEELDDVVYFVMSFVEGETLGERVRRAGPLPTPDAARIIQEVAWALAYAHGRGIVHRDVKPDNILLERGSGRALVTDFGIARVASAETFSERGEILGTMQYMSPEQAAGDGAVDGRSDLYSLGITAFFALTGRLPFESNNPIALLAMHATARAPSVTSFRPDVPLAFAESLDRCLAKDANARFPTGEALADAISNAQITRPEIAPSVRELLSAARSGAAQIAAMWTIWTAAALASERVVSAAPGTIGGPLFPLIAVLVGLTPLVLVRPMAAARGVVRAGLDQHDVADAAIESGRARDANVEYHLTRMRGLASRLSTLPVRAGFVLLAATPLVAPVFQPLLRQLMRVGATPLGLASLFELTVAVGTETFLLATALWPAVIVRALTRGTHTNAKLVRAFWTGPIGRGWLRLAGVGIPKRARLHPLDAAPTEVVLGRAASELFADLPSEARRRFSNVRDVIELLEQTGIRLRAQRDDLARQIAAAAAKDERQAVATMRPAKDAIEERLLTAVAALENLRLDLLRIREGAGAADGLTETIARARAIGEDMDIELSARRDVERLLENTPV